LPHRKIYKEEDILPAIIYLIGNRINNLGKGELLFLIDGGMTGI